MNMRERCVLPDGCLRKLHGVGACVGVGIGRCVRREMLIKVVNSCRLQRQRQRERERDFEVAEVALIAAAAGTPWSTPRCDCFMAVLNSAMPEKCKTRKSSQSIVRNAELEETRHVMEHNGTCFAR